MLIKNGVPFDVAFSLDDEKRKAWCIIYGEIEGGKFDWGTFSFQSPEKPR